MGNLFNVILEATQGVDNIIVQHNAIADNTYLGAVGNLAFKHIAASDEELGNSNQLTNLYAALYNLFELRSQHTLDSSLYVVQSVINYAVGTHVNLLYLSGLTSISVRTNVEADDESISSGSQHNVGLGNSANTGMNYNYLYFIVLNLLQRSFQSFDGALNVSFNNNVQFL